LVYPFWATAISVTAIFFNSLRGRPRLFFEAVLSVGHAPGTRVVQSQLPGAL